MNWRTPAELQARPVPQSCRPKNPEKLLPISISNFEATVQEKLLQHFLELRGKTCYELTNAHCPISHA